MRVIAGTARSMPLKTLPGNDIRPTTDKTKETLFNILQPYIPGCRFLDLFSGSGAIGIEALSRGAFFASFVERSPKAVKVIRDNLAFTKLGDRADVRQEDALSAIRKLDGRGAYDVIFLDPPFRSGQEKDALLALSSSSLLAEDGIIILETSLDTDLAFLADTDLVMVRYKKYKSHAHVFIKSKGSS